MLETPARVGNVAFETVAAGSFRRFRRVRRTQTLRELERNGLVKRIDHQEVPPRVEYELTELGRSLSDLMRKLDGWVEANITEVLAARAAFEAKQQARERGHRGNYRERPVDGDAAALILQTWMAEHPLPAADS